LTFIGGDKLNIDASFDDAFKPHAPIEKPEDFLGRANERLRVERAINQTGLHVTIYGERGAGKTSLANVSSVNFNRLRIFCTSTATFAEICKDIILEYRTFLRAHNRSVGNIVYDANRDTITIGDTIYNSRSLTANDLHHSLPSDEKLIIILDELDRLESHQTRLQIAELAKLFSTLHTNITFIFVGVANDVDELLAGHASNIRNLQQIHLGQMQRVDLLEIINKGEKVLSLTFSDNVKNTVISLSDGFPYYLHLLCTNAARSAVERNSTNVEDQDLTIALMNAAEEADQSLRRDYENAIVSSSDIFRKVLSSLASLPGTTYKLADITQRINSMYSGDVDVSPQNVGWALKQLTLEPKNSVVTVRGHGIYSFTNPLMKGFIKIIAAKNHD
jgi:uncharacterized protein